MTYKERGIEFHITNPQSNMSGNHNKLSRFWQELDVAFLLEGNFQNYDDKARLTVQTAKPIVHMNYVIEGQGALVNDAGEEQPLKASDFALVNPDEKHQYRTLSPDRTFKMICGVPKEFE